MNTHQTTKSGGIRLAARFAVLALGLWIFSAGTISAQPAENTNIAAVLSSDMKPYREALRGLEDYLGGPVPVFVLPKEKPVFTPKTLVVVAFGAKALQLEYPSSVSIVSCLAPGQNTENPALKNNRVVYISMLPGAATTAAKLKDIQPGLKTLGVLWSAKSFRSYIAALNEAVKSNGIELIEYRTEDRDGIPDGLRALGRRVEALWLPLDPNLLTQQSFEVIKEYSKSNKVPLYVSTEWLVDNGAVASIGVSFNNLGKTSGEIARKMIAREPAPDLYYPERVELTVNQAAAAQAGLKIREEILREAVRLVK
jgi:hypothetical protein